MSVTWIGDGCWWRKYDIRDIVQMQVWNTIKKVENVGDKNSQINFKKLSPELVIPIIDGSSNIDAYIWCWKWTTLN